MVTISGQQVYKKCQACHALEPGTRFAGPAIVEQVDTTTLVSPGWDGKVLEDGNLFLTTR